jgi:hypothetical protein
VRNYREQNLHFPDARRHDREYRYYQLFLYAAYTHDAYGFTEIKPLFKANKTRSALLCRLKDSWMLCLWN